MCNRFQRNTTQRTHPATIEQLQYGSSYRRTQGCLPSSQQTTIASLPGGSGGSPLLTALAMGLRAAERSLPERARSVDSRGADRQARARHGEGFGGGVVMSSRSALAGNACGICSGLKQHNTNRKRDATVVMDTGVHFNTLLSHSAAHPRNDYAG